MRNALAAAAIVASLFTAAGHSPADAAPEDRTWRPCQYEDGSSQRRCVWDARHMGNGYGQSLIIRRGGTDTATYREVSHRRAHRLLHG